MPAGNALQLTGIAVGGCLITLAGLLREQTPVAIPLLLIGWLSVYVSSHAIGHWAIGRLGGIGFVGFGIRGTDHPESYPPGLRQVMSVMPFFTALTDKASMRQARPAAKALMFAAGETSTTAFSILAAGYANWLAIPWGHGLLTVAVIFAIVTTISTAIIPKGDYAKAIRALRTSASQLRVV